MATQQVATDLYKKAVLSQRCLCDVPPFSIILMGYCSHGPCECSGQIWSPYFTHCWDNSDWSFG